MVPAPAAKIAVRTAARSSSGTKPTSLNQSMRAGASGLVPSRPRAAQTMSARPPWALSTLVWAATRATPSRAARSMRLPGWLSAVTAAIGSRTSGWWTSNTWQPRRAACSSAVIVGSRATSTARTSASRSPTCSPTLSHGSASSKGASRSTAARTAASFMAGVYPTGSHSTEGSTEGAASTGGAAFAPRGRSTAGRFRADWSLFAYHVQLNNFLANWPW